MNQEEVRGFLKEIGHHVCVTNLKSSRRSKAYLYATENDYPAIAIWHIALKYFNHDYAIKIKEGKLQTLVIEKKGLVDVIYRLGNEKEEQKISSCVEVFIGNTYGTFKNYNLSFRSHKNESDSKIELTLMKRCA